MHVTGPGSQRERPEPNTRQPNSACPGPFAHSDSDRQVRSSFAFPPRRSLGVTGGGAVVAPVRLRIVLLGGADGGVAGGVVSEAVPACWIGEVGAVGVEIVDFVVSVWLWVSVYAVLRHRCPRRHHRQGP